MVTAASDSQVKVWKISNDGGAIEEKQALPYGKKYPLALAFAALPSAPYSECPLRCCRTAECDQRQRPVDILAVGGTDNIVHLWLCSEDSVSFPLLFSAQ